jgi:hypothetical protein
VDADTVWVSSGDSLDIQVWEGFKTASSAENLRDLKVHIFVSSSFSLSSTVTSPPSSATSLLPRPPPPPRTPASLPSVADAASTPLPLDIAFLKISFLVHAGLTQQQLQWRILSVPPRPNTSDMCISSMFKFADYVFLAVQRAIYKFDLKVAVIYFPLIDCSFFLSLPLPVSVSLSLSLSLPPL